jgi:hypothetical protein
MNVYAGLFPKRLDEIAVALNAIYQGAQADPAIPGVVPLWSQGGPNQAIGGE